jgi:hypothetical protein
LQRSVGLAEKPPQYRHLADHAFTLPSLVDNSVARTIQSRRSLES